MLPFLGWKTELHHSKTTGKKTATKQIFQLKTKRRVSRILIHGQILRPSSVCIQLILKENFYWFSSSCWRTAALIQGSHFARALELTPAALEIVPWCPLGAKRGQNALPCLLRSVWITGLASWLKKTQKVITQRFMGFTCSAEDSSPPFCLVSQFPCFTRDFGCCVSFLHPGAYSFKVWKGRKMYCC